MLNSPIITPGPYPGDGQALLLRVGEEQILWSGQAIVAGTTTSVAVQLEKLKSRQYFPWGAAFELTCSGDPGVFEIDIQFSETDLDKTYVTVGTITAVNAGKTAGRYDMPNTVYPKYVRGFAKTWPNAVTAGLRVSH